MRLEPVRDGFADDFGFRAKGKIERRHDYWQKRLPVLFDADSIHSIDPANALIERLIERLVTHANHHEIHRELGTTPHAAHQLALAQKHSLIRPAPDCPWWRFIWSLRTTVRVGDDGKVPVRNVRLSVETQPRSRLTRCILHDGDIFYLKSPPKKDTLPVVLLHSAPF